jgi:hypothetical protein
VVASAQPFPAVERAIEAIEERQPVALRLPNPANGALPGPALGGARSAETAVPPPAAPAAVANAVNRQNDEQRVRATLQQYRSAYEDLDARMAQAIWPAVNASALSRAFEALHSQRLVFDDCAVQLRDAAAIATCHGSASYVRKVGSREPRVEPRTWNFTLRRAGDDWKIESARAQ